MEKRERILEEAEKLFSQKGYYGLSLSELLARCDIPKGSFYYYFPQGKIQLIQETARYSYNKMINGIRKNLFTQKTALAAYERMAEYLAKDLLGKGYFASLLLSMISIEQSTWTCRFRPLARRSTRIGSDFMPSTWQGLALGRRRA